MQCDTYTTAHSFRLLLIPVACHVKSGACPVVLCASCAFLSLYFTNDVDSGVTVFIEGYNSKEIRDPKHPLHYKNNQIYGTGERTKDSQEENGKLILAGKNED